MDIINGIANTANGYTDGGKYVDFEEIKNICRKKKNTDNHNDYQCPPLNCFGTPSGARTPDTLIKSQVLYQLS